VYPIIVVLCVFVFVKSQEFNASVEVSTVQMAGADRQLFDELKKSIADFINTTKWTDIPFKDEERISISVFLNVTGQVGPNSYRGTLKINYSRPVFGSAYTSPVMVINDEDISFTYVRGQALEFNAMQHESSNLPQIIAFYVYLILGIDFDTYSLYGGEQYYQKAQQIVINAQNSGDPGWLSSDKRHRNRYWMINYMLDNDFKPLRQFLWLYHRRGLDTMHADPEKGMQIILQSLDGLYKVHSVKPGNILLQFLMEAKYEELASIFAPAPPSVRQPFLDIMQVVDPVHAPAYRKQETQ